MIRTSWMLIALTIVVFNSMPGDADAQFGSLFGRKSSVAEISVQQLTQLNLDASQPGSSYVLVDVRAPQESSVSIIPGAITKQDFERNSQAYRNRTVITYCTSGYRSEKYAQKLINQGFAAKNFKGSILAWCRAGLPLETRGGKATNRVHTYSSRNRVPSKYKAVW